jgi:general secretion pathway protein G
MRKHAPKRKRRSGFTLLEVLLVVGILALLAAVVAPNLIGTQKRAQVDMARNQISILEDVLALYYQQNGVYPSTEQGVDALITEPEEKPTPRAWSGPYLDGKQLNDPWNSPYQYAYPGEFNKESKPDLWSFGPDGEEETDDDIGNWQIEEALEDDYPDAKSDRDGRTDRRSRDSDNRSDSSRTSSRVE